MRIFQISVVLLALMSSSAFADCTLNASSIVQTMNDTSATTQEKTVEVKNNICVDLKHFTDFDLSDTTHWKIIRLRDQTGQIVAYSISPRTRGLQTQMALEPVHGVVKVLVLKSPS